MSGRLTAFNTSKRQALSLASQMGEVVYVLISLSRGIIFCEDPDGEPGAGGRVLAWSIERHAKAYLKRWKLGDEWRPQPYALEALKGVVEDLVKKGENASWTFASENLPPQIISDHINPQTGMVTRIPWGDSSSWYLAEELDLWIKEELDGEIERGL